MANQYIDAETLRFTAQALLRLIVNLSIEVEAIKVAISLPKSFDDRLTEARKLTAKNFEPLLKQVEQMSADNVHDMLQNFQGPVQ